MPSSIIVHNTKQIIYFNYTDQKKLEDMIETLHAGVQLFRDHPEKKFRVLINVTNAGGSKEWMDESKKYGKELARRTIKSAVLGVTGIKKVLLMGYNSVVAKGMMKPFDTEKAALDYLITK